MNKMIADTREYLIKQLGFDPREISKKPCRYDVRASAIGQEISVTKKNIYCKYLANPMPFEHAPDGDKVISWDNWPSNLIYDPSLNVNNEDCKCGYRTDYNDGTFIFTLEKIRAKIIDLLIKSELHETVYHGDILGYYDILPARYYPEKGFGLSHEAVLVFYKWNGLKEIK